MAETLRSAGKSVEGKDPTLMSPRLTGEALNTHGSRLLSTDHHSPSAAVAGAQSVEFTVTMKSDLQRKMDTVTVNMELQDCVHVLYNSAGAVIAAKGASVVGTVEGIPPGSESPDMLISNEEDVVHRYFAVEPAVRSSAGPAGALPACGTTDSHSSVRVESQQSEWPIRHGVHPISTIESRLTVGNTVYMSPNHRPRHWRSCTICKKVLKFTLLDRKFLTKKIVNVSQGP